MTQRAAKVAHTYYCFILYSVVLTLNLLSGLTDLFGDSAVSARRKDILSKMRSSIYH